MVVIGRTSRSSTLDFKKRSHISGRKKIFHFLIEMSVINARIIYDKMRPQREGPRKKIPLADLLIKQLTHEAAAENIRRKIPMPVPAVELLSPETHFMETVKDDRNCRSIVSQDKEKEQQMCSVCPERPYLRRKIVSRSGTPD